MAIATNGIQLVRIAGAVFNQQLSAIDYSEILAANKTSAELDAWANAAVASEFKNKTTKDVAAALLSNVGLSSVAGLENWVTGQLNAGGGLAKAGATILGMLNDFSNMTADATYGGSATTFNAKVTNSQTLSQTAGTTTGKYADVSAAAAVSNFTLTTGVDLRTAGTGDDTYTTVNTSASQTLNAGDNINGGVGSDTLNITSTSPLAAGVGVTSTGFEKVSITATGGNFSLDTTTMTGITEITNSGSTGADVTVTALAAKVAVNLTGANANTTITHAAAAVAGTADALALTLNGANTTTAGTLSVNGFETINAVAAGTTGSSTRDLTILDDSLQTLAITGAGASSIAATLSGATGAVVGTVTGGDGAETLTITPGSSALLSISTNGGNDRVNISSIAATHTIAGGDGTDTLSTSTSITTTNGANISGFETVRITAAGVTVALPATNTVGTLTVWDAVGGTLTNLAAGGTVNLRDGGAATVTNTAGWTGATDAITLNVGATTSTGSTGSGTTSNVTAALIETATINNLQASTDTSTRTMGVTGTSLKTMNVVSSGSAAIVIAGGGTLLTAIDASGVNGAVSTTAATAAAGFSLTTGAGADTLTGGTGNDTLSGGAGNDSITGSVGQDRLTGGTGVDTFVFSANATGAVVSNQSAPDTIVDFTTGTDKITGTGATTFLPGPFTSFTQGNAAALAAGGTNVAFFSTSDQTLYVQATAGTQAANDIAIYLPTVTTFAAGDLLLGSMAGGNALTLAAATVPVVNTTASNATSNTLTTSMDDVITSAASTALVGNAAAINGGTGTDTLNATLATAGLLTTLTSGSTSGVALTSIETVNLTTTVGGLVTLGSLPTDLRTITLTSTDLNGALNAVTTAANQTVTVNNTLTTTGSEITVGAFAGNTITTGSAADSVSVSASNATVNTSVGNDTITVSNMSAVTGVLGTSTTGNKLVLDGGLGTDALTFAGGLIVTADLSNTSNISMTGIETLNLGAVATGNSAVTLAAGTALRTLSGTTATGNNIFVTMTAAQLDALTTINSGASNGTFSITVTDTVTTTVDLSDTTLTSVANMAGTGDVINFGAVLAANVATVTIGAQNILIAGGAGANDVLNVNADAGAISQAQTAFETVNFITAAQTSAITAAVGAVRINSAVNQAGLTMAAATTTFTQTAGTGTVIDSADNLAQTFTNSGSGRLTVTLAANTAADTITNSGTGTVTVNQAASTGITTVTLAANSAVDNINYANGTTAANGVGATTAANRVVVTGFGTNDVIILDITGTTAGTAAAASPIQQVIANNAAVTFNTTSDVKNLAFDMGGVVDVLAGITDGAGLIANMGAITVTNTNTDYLIAYDNGNAYLYAVAATGTTLTAGMVTLIGVFNGVAAGAIGSVNLLLAE